MGITPAHAGKSFAEIRYVLVEKDHPRPCGEKPTPRTPAAITSGSPPPMRGKDRRCGSVHVFKGITPAHAGKRSPRGCTLHRARDHPRPCGEKTSWHDWARRLVGSPPPMRGKAMDLDGTTFYRRITPAHAGKRKRLYSVFVLFKDHPRPCGEKWPSPPLVRALRGSPPPMRGKVLPCKLSVTPLRITPAHAGKRTANDINQPVLKDHPRPCGEKARSH